MDRLVERPRRRLWELAIDAGAVVVAVAVEDVDADALADPEGVSEDAWSAFPG